MIPDSLLHIYWSLSYVSTCTNFRAIIVPSIPLIASTYRFSFCPVFYTCSVLLDDSLIFIYIILACLWCIGLLKLLYFKYYHFCYLLKGGGLHYCNIQIHVVFYPHLINHVQCGIWISQSYVSCSLSVT